MQKRVVYPSKNVSVNNCFTYILENGIVIPETHARILKLRVLRHGINQST